MRARFALFTSMFVLGVLACAPDEIDYVAPANGGAAGLAGTGGSPTTGGSSTTGGAAGAGGTNGAGGSAGDTNGGSGGDTNGGSAGDTSGGSAGDTDGGSAGSSGEGGAPGGNGGTGNPGPGGNGNPGAGGMGGMANPGPGGAGGTNPGPGGSGGIAGSSGSAGFSGSGGASGSSTCGTETIVSNASAVAIVAGGGYLYWYDDGDHSIHRASPDGSGATTWLGDLTSEVTAMAFAPMEMSGAQNALYALDASGTIQRITAMGASTVWITGADGGLSAPTGLAIDTGGAHVVYVSGGDIRWSFTGTVAVPRMPFASDGSVSALASTDGFALASNMSGSAPFQAVDLGSGSTASLGPVFMPPVFTLSGPYVYGAQQGGGLVRYAKNAASGAIAEPVGQVDLGGMPRSFASDEDYVYWSNDSGVVQRWGGPSCLACAEPCGDGSTFTGCTIDGSCVVGRCSMGHFDCDDDGSNGCEATAPCKLGPPE